jgi:nicotinamide-nucleotide amidase
MTVGDVRSPVVGESACVTLLVMAGSGREARAILAAEILSVGSEIVNGETVDTNASELSRGLATLGVTVGRITAVPDDLAVVSDAFDQATRRVDLVVSTGGLGPTPDDLTREAIAEVAAETPAVDPAIEAWLRGLWDRRGMPFSNNNLKQAWLIPSATAIPNDNGTAPGWWVELHEGAVVVALPGPPREMRPMWSGWVLPRLRERGAGADVEVRTLRLTGVGESQVADRLGDRLLRGHNPIVATYARVDGVDVRISARTEGRTGTSAPRSARELADEAEAVVLAAVGEHVWARGDTRWPDAIGDRMRALGWRAACTEIGLGGELLALCGDAEWLVRGVAVRLPAPGEDVPRSAASLESLAERARAEAGVEVGLAVRASARGSDTAVSVAVVSPFRSHMERRLVFLGGPQGRLRGAITAAAVLLAELDRARRSTVPARGDTADERGNVEEVRS